MSFILVIVMNFPGQQTLNAEARFATLAECERALEKATIVIPSHNNENEWAGFKVCLPEGSAKYSPRTQLK